MMFSHLTGNFLQYKSKCPVSMILRMTACHAVKSQRHYSPILQGYRLFLNDYQGRAHRSPILRQKNRSHLSFQTQNAIAERCANQFLIASFLPWWNILLNTSQKSYCIFIPRTQRSIYRYKPYLGGDKATQTHAQEALIRLYSLQKGFLWVFFFLFFEKKNVC